MLSVTTAPTAILSKLHPLWVQSLVLRSVVVPILTVLTSEDDFVARHRMPPLKGHSAPCTTFVRGATRPELFPAYYSIISVTTPAPTVRPPSRIANRSSGSIAMGVISSTSICTLSPGMTISTPPGRFAAPVTSVVRK